MNFKAPFRMLFCRSKSTLGSLKSVFNGLGGNSHWVALTFVDWKVHKMFSSVRIINLDLSDQ